MDPLVIVLAFAGGLLIQNLGYPPLLGYLIAGFVANAMNVGSLDSLAPLADAGVVLLLFTIGLKLKPSALAPRYVWGSALLHMFFAVPLTALVIVVVGMLYTPLSLQHTSSAWALAFALSFSSTVFAIKICEERGESASFYATIAVGILVVQDLMAVVYLSIATGQYPTPYALLLLLLLFSRPVLRWLLNRVGHGELLLFSGIVFALTMAELFELVHIKGGLGALLIGALIAHANKRKAKELYDRLAALKNLLLIGFFVQIGYYGFPSVEMIVVAAILALLTILRPILYFSLFSLFQLRVRTAFMSSLLLFNYSEFGLIVAAASVQAGLLSPDWITTLALAMSLSFFLATPANNTVKSLYLKHRARLSTFERSQRLPEEAIEQLGDVNTAILGMGRIGRKAYDTFQTSGHDTIVGIEEDYELTQRLKLLGLNCVHGDASDRDFWERTKLADCNLILVGLSNHRENLAVVTLAKELGYTGQLAVTARFPDEKAALEQLGCIAFNFYEEAGTDFAQHVMKTVTKTDSSTTSTHP